MKKWIFLLALCLSALMSASPIQDRRIDPEALSELAQALGISPDADLIAETQKQWLRKPGQERWDQTELSPEQRLFVLDWAEKQGLFAPWEPSCNHYDQALILGATTPRMQTRLDYLKECWQEGIRFKEIVWLTGERPLDPKVDALLDQCKNESEAAHLIWEEAELPEEMAQLPVVFISVPMKPSGKRPTTEDTLIAWLQASPEPCKALFVSDQPFCGYQFAVIKTCLPPSYLFDVIGRGENPHSHLAAAAITLDSIARWIYQESSGGLK